MNHKRGKKKDGRAGCLLCKPHKMNALVGRGAKPKNRMSNSALKQYMAGTD